MDQFRFASWVPEHFHGEVERWLYFNPRQSRVKEAIGRALSEFGIPELIVADGRLRVSVPGRKESQCIFAVQPEPAERPVGLVLFSREDEERLLILHLAVHEDFSSFGEGRDGRLASRLVGQVLEVGRRLSEVKAVHFAYLPGLVLPVSRSGNRSASDRANSTA